MGVAFDGLVSNGKEYSGGQYRRAIAATAHLAEKICMVGRGLDLN